MWAQVKAKQEALFSDGSFLKVDAGAAISSRVRIIITAHHV